MNTPLNGASDLLTVLALGDVVGRSGRGTFQKLIGDLKQNYKPDVILLNGENLAGGNGVTEKILKELLDKFEVDVVTTGNHWSDQKEIYQFESKYSQQLLLPGNMYNVNDESRGFCLKTSKCSKRVPYVVINVLGRVFMKGDNRCPFTYVDQILKRIPKSVKVIIADIHGEASSEKQALAQYLDGRVSLVYGTHTHCQTADEQILKRGTGFITDVGMTGAYDAVIGIKTEAAIDYLKSGNKGKFEIEDKGPFILCGVLGRIDGKSGECRYIERIRIISKS